MSLIKIFAPILILITCTTHEQNNSSLINEYYESTLSISQEFGDSGIVYFSINSGESWVNKSRGIPEDVFLTDITMYKKSIGLATKQNGIYVYEFSNDQWRKISNIPTSTDINALLFLDNNYFIGSDGDGIFKSENGGKNWQAINSGLENLIIRKIIDWDNKIFAGTNGGLFIYNEDNNKWEKLYGDNFLQVNGIAFHENEIYIGTNRGAYKATINTNKWQQILPDCSLHNISAVNGVIYAMVYNELFISQDKGKTWYSDQSGMPVGKYSFQVVASEKYLLNGQWDGIYRKELSWVKSDNGLPDNIPITEMKVNGSLLVCASSQWWKEN